MNRSSLSPGFTMIELIVVLLLIGILGAMALPRFLSIDDEAKRAAANATLGAFTTSAAGLHGQWRAEGSDASALIVDGATITFGDEGYPDVATNDVAGCIGLWNAVLRSEYRVDPFVFGTENPEWSAFRIGGWCLYLFEAGAPYDPSSTPLFLYFPEALPPTYQAGDVLQINF